jgi:HK97 family phage portal protein
MGWFGYQNQKVERKSGVLGESIELGSFFSLGSGTAISASSALSLFEQSTSVSVPIGMITNPFSVLEPMLLIDNKVIKDHPVIDLINKPSPYFSKELLLEFLAKEYLITGECSYITLGGFRRPPLAIEPISMKNVSIIEGPGGIPTSMNVSGNTLSGVYKPNIKNGILRYSDGGLRNLAHIRMYSTKSNARLNGQSPLLAASKEIRQHILGGRHNVSLLEKGGRLSLIFHYEQDMDEEDFDITKNRVKSQYSGADEAGTIAVTAGGELTIKEVGINNRDMDFANLQKMAIKAVALQYNVPLPLVTDERQTLNNYQEGKVALYDDAVIPLSRRIFGAIGMDLLPRYGIDPKRARITFDPDEVSALVSRRNKELKVRASLAIESDNELRALINREGYEGGDQIYKQASLIPVGTDVSIEDNDPDFIENPDA